MVREVEIRAPLSASQYAKTLDELTSNLPVSIESRCFIDFSTVAYGIGERRQDIRIRVTDGNLELVVKHGRFGGYSREEAVICVDIGQLEKLGDVLSLLGFSQGVLCARKIARARIGNVEVALQQVLEPECGGSVVDHFIEVELVDPEGELEARIEEARCFLTDRGFQEFSEQEWYLYVKELNRKASVLYVHGETSIELVRQLGIGL